MNGYAFHLFSSDGHIGEKFEGLEEAANFLLAWTRGNAHLPTDESLYIIIRPSFKKESE